MSNFHVGQKVVCVNGERASASWARGGKWDGELIKGDVYTVAAVGLTHFMDPEQLPCILVAEIDRPSRQPFWAHRFRPVKTTDISVFTAMLAPTPRVPVRA